MITRITEIDLIKKMALYVIEQQHLVHNYNDNGTEEASFYSLSEFFQLVKNKNTDRQSEFTLIQRVRAFKVTDKMHSAPRINKSVIHNTDECLGLLLL